MTQTPKGSWSGVDRAASTARAGDAQPDRAGTRLAIGQDRAVAVNVLRLEAQRLGLAGAGIDQESQRGDGNRVIRLPHR